MVVALAAAVGACGSPGGGATGSGEIVIGSFGFSESEILGEVYRQGLESSGFAVTHKSQIGPREVVNGALAAGEVDFVPEYVGSALEVGFGGMPSADGESTRQDLAAAFESAKIEVLQLAPAQATNAFVVSRTTAEALGLTSLSDLARLPQPIDLGGPPECSQRPRCQLGLESVYGLQIEFTALDAGGPLTLQALQRGDIQLGLFLSTQVFDPELVVLEDDLGLQPAENIVPVVRGEIIEEHGNALIDRINEISAMLTTESLTEMNRQFDVERRDAAEIAATWLEEAGL